MASPHVAGAAAVLFSHKPSATVAEAKAALVDTGDPIAGLSDKTVSGRRLNLNAALSSPAIRADTTTTINSHDPDPSVIGEAVTVHYSVASEALAGDAPTGNVTVSDGTESCTGTVAAGQCTLVHHGGQKSLTATYTGDDAYYNSSPASDSVSHEVNRADTTTTITADDPDPSVPGQAVTVDFTVTSGQPQAGTPTGNVTVTDGVDSRTATVSTGACDITLTTGGTGSLTATYDGNSSLSGSTSAAEPHTVSQFATTPPPPAEQQSPADQRPADHPPADQPPAAPAAPSRPGCELTGNVIVGTTGDDRRSGGALTDIMLGAPGRRHPAWPGRRRLPVWPQGRRPPL